MKCIKRMLLIFIFIILLNVSNCFAVILDNTNITEDKLKCYRTYIVQKNEKDSFVENLDKDIEVFGDNYTYESYTIEYGNYLDTIDITTTKKITSKTNNLQSIINQLGTTISYEQNGYVGEYLLNTQNIQIKTNYNGFREDLVEETINYYNLERNDLDFIPKQTTKDGLILDLLNVDWIVETTKMIGEYENPDTYTAKCYYAGKQKIDYPNTYSITAQYSGKATKEAESPYTIIVEYKKTNNEVPKVIENQDGNFIPITSGTIVIILVVLIFFNKNVTVYNLKDGKYRKIGKVRINRKNTIKLDKFLLFETTNKYKIKFSRKLTSKMKCKMITVSKGKSKIKILVNTYDERYIAEVRI